MGHSWWRAHSISLFSCSRTLFLFYTRVQSLLTKVNKAKVDPWFSPYEALGYIELSWSKNSSSALRHVDVIYRRSVQVAWVMHKYLPKACSPLKMTPLPHSPCPASAAEPSLIWPCDSELFPFCISHNTASTPYRILKLSKVWITDYGKHFQDHTQHVLSQPKSSLI